VLFYVIWALVISWPLILHLRSSLFGAVPGDISGAIAQAREVVDHRVFPFAPATLRDFNAPLGLQQPWVLNLATAPGTVLVYGLSFLLGPIAGYAMFMLGGFVASGTAMFLLAKRMTQNAWAALVAGAAFAFSPFAVNKAMAHPHFVHGWVLVLAVWRLIVVAENPTKRNGLVAGACTALAMWFTPYFILIGGVAFAACAGATLVAAPSRARLPAAKACVWALVPICGLLLGLAVLQRAGSPTIGNVQTYGLDELTWFSARLHEYVVPDRNQPIFGAWTGPFLARRIHRSNFSESSLYLGVTVMALAVAGAVISFRRRTPSRAIPGSLVLCGLAFSLRPKVGLFGAEIPAPSWFVFQLTSTWRVYSRFVILVMLGVALLAAAGLNVALRRLRPGLVVPVAMGVLSLVLVDLWARPPGAVTSPGAPTVYRVLARQPPGLVAEYPILPAATPNYAAIWYQGVHDKPIINGYKEGEDESRKLELANLGDAETGPDLARLGVRYAVVHKEYDLSPPVAGFELLHRDRYAALYRVTAVPAGEGVDGLSGFAVPEGPPDGEYRWLGAATGRVLVWATCGRCAGVLTFQTSSAGTPRVLRISQAGREIHRQVVPPTPVTMTVPVSLVDGRAVLSLTVAPGPTTGSGDPRALAITFGEPSFEPTPGAATAEPPSR
jgi:hypothetical protein